MVDLRTVTTLPRQLLAYVRLKHITWLDDAPVGACKYPRGAKSLQDLVDHGVTVLVNLHERPHPAATLARFGLTEIHLPVPDFTPPTPAQLAQGVTAIEQVVRDGRRVAVHCGAGLGRTGTLLACYLVKRGLAPDDAIAHIRALRPGSVETSGQAAAVRQYAAMLRSTPRDERNS